LVPTVKRHGVSLRAQKTRGEETLKGREGASNICSTLGIVNFDIAAENPCQLCGVFVEISND